MRKPKIILGLVALVAVTLTGCAGADTGAVFLPPGAELGDRIIDPPAPLPPAVDIVSEDPEEFDYSICGAIVDVDPQAVQFINFPLFDNDGVQDPSINGVRITEAKQTAVDNPYASVFQFLIRANGDDGEIYWFGSKATLNESSVSELISLRGNRQEPIFGATEATRENFIWGEALNSQTELIASAERTVAAYATCFEPRSGQVPTESRALSPEAAVALVRGARAIRAIDPRLTELLNQQFRWDENLKLVDNGSYGSLLLGRNATGTQVCLSDFGNNGSLFETRVTNGQSTSVTYIVYANATCAEPGLYLVDIADQNGAVTVSTSNPDSQAYVTAFQGLFANARP